MEIGSKRKSKSTSKGSNNGEKEKRSKGEDDDDESNIELPPGWTKRFSVRKNQHYYFNKSTGESCWHVPGQSNTEDARKPGDAKKSDDSRKDYFAKIHKKLMLKLAEKDSWHAIKAYALQKAPSFNKKFRIPAAYIDLVKKNPDIDIVAKLLLPLDIPNIKPLVTDANGNCLFNAFSMIFFGSDERHIELRVRVVCELAINEHVYLNNDKLRTMSDESVQSCNLVQYLMSISESYFSSNGDLKEAFREETIQTIFDSRYCSMIHIYAMANVLNVMIHSVYPNITNVGVNRKIHHQIISPWSSGDLPKMPIYVMWSNKTELHVTKEWTPDHFVACLPQNFQPQMYAVSMKASSMTSFDNELVKKLKKGKSSKGEKSNPGFEKAKTVQQLIAELVNQENGEFKFLPTGEAGKASSSESDRTGKKPGKLLPKVKAQVGGKATSGKSALNTSIVSYSGSETSDSEEEITKQSSQEEKEEDDIIKMSGFKLGKRKSESGLKENHTSKDESDGEVKSKKQNLESDTVESEQDKTGAFKGLKFTMKSPQKKVKAIGTLNKIWDAAKSVLLSNSQKKEKESNRKVAPVAKDSKNSVLLHDKVETAATDLNTEQLKLDIDALMPRSLALGNKTKEPGGVSDRKILKATTRKSLTSDDQINLSKSETSIHSKSKQEIDHISLLDSIVKTQQEFHFNQDGIVNASGDHEYQGEKLKRGSPDGSEDWKKSYQPSKVSRKRSGSSNDSGLAIPSYEQLSTPPWSQKSGSSFSPEHHDHKHSKRRSRSSSTKSRSDSPYDPFAFQPQDHVSPLNRVKPDDMRRKSGSSERGDGPASKPTAADPLKFLTGMLGLGDMTKAQTVSAGANSSKEESDMEVDETELQSEQFLNEAKGLYVVVDTNVLIDDMDFVIELKDQHFPDIGRPSIVFPFVVLQELDNVKMGKSSNYDLDFETKGKARTAINVMNSLLESNHPRFIGQTAKQNKERRFDMRNNDDRILQCCFQYQKMYVESKVVLLTNDKHLRNKSIVSEVATFSKTTFIKWLDKLKSKEETTQGIAVVGVTSNVPTGVPPLLQNILTPKSVQQKPSIVPYNSTQVFQTSGVCDNSRSKTPPKPVEVKKYTETDLADDILCDLKSSLRDCLADVLEEEMKAVYSELWQTIVYKKPPWTLSDILMSIDKHWIAVFGHVLSKETKGIIESLKQHFKPTQSFGHNLKYVKTIVIDSCLLCSQLEKQLKQTGAIKRTLCDIQILKTVTKSVIGGETELKKLTILKEDIHKRNTEEENMQISKSTENVLRTLSDEDIQMIETPSSSFQNNNVNDAQEAQRCFQLAWEIVLNGYNMLSEKLVKEPYGPERKEILEFFAKLCANIGAIHVTYSGSLQGQTESVQKLCQALNKFAIELNVENWKPVVFTSMSIFFSDSTQRTILEGGLQQLETMMTGISGLQSYLSPGEVHGIELYSNSHTQSLGI